MSTQDTPNLHPQQAEWKTLLHGAGLRVTSQRLSVLEFLHHHPHSDVETIYQQIRTELPKISQQAIHVIVQDLLRHGIIRRVDLPFTRSAVYETRSSDNHHHLQCIHCHRIEDVDCAVGPAPCLTPADDHGMRVVSAEVIYRAVCQQCERTIND